MKADITHITELTRQDLRDLAAVADVQAGFCIRIDKVDGKLRISVDETALRNAINGFIRNGGGTTNAEGAQNVSFNPPS